MKEMTLASRLLCVTLLSVGVLGCSKIYDRIDNVSSRVDDIENSQNNEIQSIAFVPEFSDGIARVHYDTEENGSFTRGNITLRFAITPAEIAVKLAESWNSSLSLDATYTKTKAVAAGDDISIPILEASASNGKLTLTASAETIDEAFFKKELSASVRLVVKLDGISKSSEYVPMIPIVDSGAETGENINIPDIYFKAYLVDNFDVNGDGEISVDEALAVKEINIASSSLPIRSLSGIEHFTKLEKLDCSGNNLSEVDLKSNAALRTLNCSDNSLTALDLSDKLYLTDVDCSGNKINNLLLTNACGLRNLDCSDNDIEEINLHDGQFISRLDCYSNPIKKLVLDNNAELAHLFIQSEASDAIEETAITITGMSSLESIVLSGDFTDVNVSGNKSLMSLDVDRLSNLKSLVAAGCAFTSIDVMVCQSLTRLNVKDNFLHDIDVRNNPSLEELNVSGNALSGLNVRNNAALKTLDISGNRDISFVDLRNNHSLEDLIASSLSISELDLTAITQLKTLDVTDNAKLKRIFCPSQKWLENVMSVNDDLNLTYVDSEEKIIVKGGTIEIDGLVWAKMNVGWRTDNLYGGIYTFDDSRKVCPDGWRTPTKDEFESLSAHTSGVTIFKETSGCWYSGSKTYSESVPAVFMPYLEGSTSGHYWSSTEYDSNYAYSLDFAAFEVHVDYSYRLGTYSVRCVKSL